MLGGDNSVSYIRYRRRRRKSKRGKLSLSSCFCLYSLRLLCCVSGPLGKSNNNNSGSSSSSSRSTTRYTVKEVIWAGSGLGLCQSLRDCRAKRLSRVVIAMSCCSNYFSGLYKT